MYFGLMSKIRTCRYAHINMCSRYVHINTPLQRTLAKRFCLSSPDPLLSYFAVIAVIPLLASKSLPAHFNDVTADDAL